MDASSHFRGKKVTLMGLGLLGRGAGDAEYLAKCGAELIVTDLKSPRELEDSLAPIRNFPNITFVLGEHRLEDFKNRDLIVKGAGVPLDSEYIEEAKKNNIPVRMSADLFMEYSGLQTIGVTGTRGKSTVTHMIAEILAVAGKKTIVGGNVRGISTLALLEQVHGDEVAVLELDSWQCAGLGEAKLSPHIAVFTTFYQDHLNYYHGDTDAYLADKANIFLNQKPGDLLILGSQCAGVVQNKYQKQFKGKFEVWGVGDLPKEWKLIVPGEHNRYDAALALAVARALKLDDAVTKKALENFKGVPGRLEFLKEVKGVKIYNDNSSTTPEATIAAIQALKDVGPIRIIMGGADKGLNLDDLLKTCVEHVEKGYLLSGAGTKHVHEKLSDAPVFESLRDAVRAAMSEAQPGDLVLFSPAFASFGMFRNEYDRGDQFVELVRHL